LAQAAIDGQLDAGDLTAGFGRQEECRLSDFIGLPNPSERDLLRQSVLGKGLPKYFGEDFCDVIVILRLVTEAIRLSVMLLRIEETRACDRRYIVAVDPAEPSVSNVVTDHAFFDRRPFDVLGSEIDSVV
jgi:hypothetical protein